jgi:hypothetical protein
MCTYPTPLAQVSTTPIPVALQRHLPLARLYNPAELRYITTTHIKTSSVQPASGPWRCVACPCSGIDARRDMVQGLRANGAMLRVREPLSLPSDSAAVRMRSHTLIQGPRMAAILPLAYSSHARWRLSWREDRLAGLSLRLQRVPRVPASKRHRRSHRYPAISLSARASRPVKMCVFLAVRAVRFIVALFTATRLRGRDCSWSGSAVIHEC